MSITSPCISVCVTDPTSDLCYGCARTTNEIAKWSSLTDKEKLETIGKGYQLWFTNSSTCRRSCFIYRCKNIFT